MLGPCFVSSTQNSQRLLTSAMQQLLFCERLIEQLTCAVAFTCFCKVLSQLVQMYLLLVLPRPPQVNCNWCKIPLQSQLPFTGLCIQFKILFFASPSFKVRVSSVRSVALSRVSRADSFTRSKEATQTQRLWRCHRYGSKIAMARQPDSLTFFILFKNTLLLSGLQPSTRLSQ